MEQDISMKKKSIAIKHKRIDPTYEQPWGGGKKVAVLAVLSTIGSGVFLYNAVKHGMMGFNPSVLSMAFKASGFGFCAASRTLDGLRERDDPTHIEKAITRGMSGIVLDTCQMASGLGLMLMGTSGTTNRDDVVVGGAITYYALPSLMENYRVLKDNLKSIYYVSLNEKVGMFSSAWTLGKENVMKFGGGVGVSAFLVAAALISSSIGDGQQALQTALVSLPFATHVLSKVYDINSRSGKFLFPFGSAKDSLTKTAFGAFNLGTTLAVAAYGAKVAKDPYMVVASLSQSLFAVQDFSEGLNRFMRGKRPNFRGFSFKKEL